MSGDVRHRRPGAAVGARAWCPSNAAGGLLPCICAGAGAPVELSRRMSPAGWALRGVTAFYPGPGRGAAGGPRQASAFLRSPRRPLPGCWSRCCCPPWCASAAMEHGAALILMPLVAGLHRRTPARTFAGRAFGKHKLAPELISPKKTVEGAMGGVASAVSVRPALRPGACSWSAGFPGATTGLGLCTASPGPCAAWWGT